METGQQIIAKLWGDIQRSQWERDVAAAKADPVKHKKTRAFPPGTRMNYRFYARKDGRERTVRYCWSTERNAAGYFLAWRETIGRKQAKRDMWIASKRRMICKLKCAARAAKHTERLNAKTAPAQAEAA